MDHIDPGTLKQALAPVAEREEPNRLRNTWDDIAMPILRTLQEMEVEQGGNPFGADVSQIEERLGIDTSPRSAHNWALLSTTSSSRSRGAMGRVTAPSVTSA